MPAVLEKFGLRLPYPETWRVEEGVNPHWPESLSIESPQGAFWSVSIHPSSEKEQDLTVAVVDAFRQEYGDVEVEPVRETIAGTDRSGFNLNFYCLDLLIQARLRAFASGGRKFVVLCQGEDREFERQSTVFEAMTRALVDPSLADRVARPPR